MPPADPARKAERQRERRAAAKQTPEALAAKAEKAERTAANKKARQEKQNQERKEERRIGRQQREALRQYQIAMKTPSRNPRTPSRGLALTPHGKNAFDFLADQAQKDREAAASAQKQADQSVAANQKQADQSVAANQKQADKSVAENHDRTNSTLKELASSRQESFSSLMSSEAVFGVVKEEDEELSPRRLDDKSDSGSDLSEDEEEEETVSGRSKYSVASASKKNTISGASKKETSSRSVASKKETASRSVAKSKTIAAKKAPSKPPPSSRSTRSATKVSRSAATLAGTDPKKKKTRTTDEYEWKRMDGDELTVFINKNKHAKGGKMDDDEKEALFKQAFDLGLFDEEVLNRFYQGLETKGKKKVATRPFIQSEAIQHFQVHFGFPGTSDLMGLGANARAYCERQGW